MSTATPSYTSRPKNINSLAPPVNVNVTKEQPIIVKKSGSNVLLWFILASLAAWLAFYFVKPAIVQTRVAGVPTGNADIWKSLIAGLLVGAAVALLVWLLTACR